MLIYIGTLVCKQTRLKDSVQEGLGNILRLPLGKGYGGAISRGPQPESRASHDNTVFSECDSNHISIFLRGLSRQGLWPSFTNWRARSLKDILTALDNCAFVTPSSSHNKCYTCGIDIAYRVKEIAKTISTAFDGLCLDCVVNGRPVDGEAKPCRVSHSEFMGLDKA